MDLSGVSTNQEQRGQTARDAAAWPVVSALPSRFVPLHEALERFCRVESRGKRNGTPPIVEYAGRLYIDGCLHPAFPVPDCDLRGTDEFPLLPKHRQERANLRLRVLLDLDAYIERHKWLGRSRAMDQFISERQGHYQYDHDGTQKTLRISRSGLFAWRRNHTNGGLLALAGKQRGGGERALSVEAIDYFKRLRARGCKHSIAYCFRQVRRQADAHGWTWFRSVSACRAWAREGGPL